MNESVFNSWDGNTVGISSLINNDVNVKISEYVKKEILNEVNNRTQNITKQLYVNKTEKITINKLIKQQFNINSKEYFKFFVEPITGSKGSIIISCYLKENHHLALDCNYDNAKINYNYICLNIDKENHIRYTYILDKDDVENWVSQVGEYSHDNHIKSIKVEPKFKLYQKVYFVDRNLIKIEKCNDVLWNILTENQKCEYYLKNYKDSEFIRIGYIIGFNFDSITKTIVYNIETMPSCPNFNKPERLLIKEEFIANTNAEAIEIAVNNNPSK